MGVILKELFDKLNDKKLELVAGKKGILNVVTWLQMVENEENALYIRENEIAFIAGVGIKSESELLEIIKILYRRDTSGVIVNLGGFISSIDNNIITYCNEIDLPLFVVENYSYMLDIKRNFYTFIVEKNNTKRELKDAIKNAICNIKEDDLYIPIIKSHGYNIDWKYCVVVIEASKVYYINLDNYINLNWNNVICIKLNKKIVIVFADYNFEEIISIMENIKDYLIKKYKNESMHFAIGENYKNIKKLSKSYEQAKKIIALSKCCDNKNRLINYSDLGIYKLLVGVDDKEVLKEFYLEKLGRLENYDKNYETDYLDVLYCYLRNDGSLKNTASELFIHRNTVNYKINKIQSIMECNLSELENKLEILMAYKVRDVLEIVL